MHEFETFAYLDVQKTGSTFIISFLRKFCVEKEIQRKKHQSLSNNYDRSKFYFITIRNPLDQYLSLYSFGCESKGKLFRKLDNEGYGGMYDGTWRGFRSWLAFVLEPENAYLLGDGYGRGELAGVSQILGYQSYRVLALALPDATNVLANCGTREAISERYKEKNVVNFTVRYETFRSDLAELIRTRLGESLSNVEESLRFIATEEAHNVSDRIDRYEASPTLTEKERHLLREREWLMYEEFGYEDSIGRPR